MKKIINKELADTRDKIRIIPLNLEITKEDLKEIYSQNEKD